MINFIKRKLEKRKIKNTFKEYGYEIKKFNIPGLGELEYAQWLHPFEGTKLFSTESINFYKHFVKDGDLVIDIGSHSGDTTIPMAVAAGKSGLVLALEPNPYVFKVLKVNAGLNKNNTNILPLCFAATEKDGKFIFNYSDASFCNGGNLSQNTNQNHHHNFELEVEGRNLSHYLEANHHELLPKLSLIKIDAEGFDKEIIKNLSEIIIEYRPTLLVECYKKLTQEERYELYDVIVEKGYTLYYLEDFHENSKKEKIGKDDMTKRKHFDMLALPNEKDSLLQ